MSHAVNDEQDDDAREVRAANAGDHQAFARIYDRHAAVVLSVCRQGGGRLGDAEDACQETFIRAFAMLDRLEHSDRPNLRRWLYAIARRVCSERRRAWIRRIKHEDLAMKQTALIMTDRIDQMGDAAHCGAQTELLDHLTAALDQLDDRERLAIHLHYLDTDPMRAAELVLGLSRSGYYKLLARARQRLADLMGLGLGNIKRESLKR